MVVSPAVFVAMAANASKSTEIQRNYASKEMGDETLSPGKSLEGFVYFNPIPKGLDWSLTSVVKATFTEIHTHQATVLTIPLAH